MRSIYFSLFFLFFSQFIAARTTITGRAEAYKGMRIKISCFQDYISETPEILSIDKVAEDGSFKLYSDREELVLGKIELEKYYALIYLEPNTEYQVIIPEYTGELNDVLNAKYPVNLEIIKPENERLNSSIVEFNGSYDSFVKEHFILILRRGAKSQVDSFKTNFNPTYGATGLAYFETYRTYSHALLDLISSHSKKEMYSNYLAEGSIQYENDAYMKFFQEFYKDFFKAFYFVEDEVQLIMSVENHQSIDSLSKVLAKHSFLKRADIRELVMIKELYFSTVNGRFKKKDSHKMLLDIKGRTEIEEHKLIIKNLLNKEKKMALGSTAPEFSLRDQFGNTKNLSDYRGKYVYLDFWATWCAPCLKSMRMMNELYPKYRDSVEFVSISIDKNESKMKKFLENEKYPWTFLHYNGNEKLKEDYQILAVPTYYFIDPKGRLIQSPALHPESGMERYFKEVSKTQDKPKQNRFWEEKPKDK